MKQVTFIGQAIGNIKKKTLETYKFYLDESFYYIYYIYLLHAHVFFIAVLDSSIFFFVTNALQLQNT